MDIRCPRCGGLAIEAGYEDARTFHSCPTCQRVWTTMVTAPQETSSGEAPVRVLVVDDSDSLAGLISSWLEEDSQYKLFVATSGRQALDVAAAQSPEIVLLDLIMPYPDGFAVCEQLQQAKVPPEILLMTGISEPWHLRRALDLGVVSVLRKPLTREVVLDNVAIAAKRCRQASLIRLRSEVATSPRLL